MTKPEMLATGVRREDIAGLNLLAGDYDPVDQRLNPLAPLLEGHVPEAGRDPAAERLQGGRHPEQIAEPIGLTRELRHLLHQCRSPPLDLDAETPVLRHGDD